MASESPKPMSKSMSLDPYSARGPMIRRSSSTTVEPKRKFQRQFSTEELVHWLKERGVGATDCAVLENECFTGESFVLLESDSIKSLGVKIGGQLMLRKLVEEANQTPETPDELEDTVRVPTLPGPNHLTVTSSFDDAPTGRTNQFSRSASTDVWRGSNTITNDFGSSASNDLGSTAYTNQFRSLGEYDMQTSTNQFRSLGEHDFQTGVTPMSNAVTSNSVSAAAGISDDGFRVPDTPPHQQTQDNEDVTRVEEVPVYCTEGRDEGTSVFSYDHDVFMYKDKVWSGRDVLKVYFVNESHLRQWGLDADRILEWAGSWNIIEDDRIPVFEQTMHAAKADVRVKFSNTQGCWSMIGMDAEKISPPEPTMILNLAVSSEKIQRSLVIHEFGHVLGLDHEHQRSDFWDVVKNFIDVRKIPQEQQSRVLKRKDIVEGDATPEYDERSIMHYWFDPTWIKNQKYKVARNVQTDRMLSDKERTYLLGILKRQGSEMLPEKPSRADLQQLWRAYGDTNQPCVYAVGSGLDDSASSECHERTPLRVDQHLRGVHQAVWDARAKWYTIGQALRIPHNALDAIRLNSNNNSGVCLMKLLEVWMHTANAYVEDLMEVLRSPAVGRGDLAAALARETEHWTG